MVRFLVRGLPVAFLGLVLSAASAGAQLIGNGFGGTLYDVNPVTGVFSNPRATGINNLVGVTYSLNGTTLYGLNTFGISNPNSLFTINPVTGASTLVGATGLSNIFEGDIALDPTSGVLYGIQDVPANNVRNIFTINTSTGAATTVGNINSVGDLSAMAFDSAGNLFVIDSNLGKLLTVNKSNASILNSVNLSATLGSSSGLAIDPTTGTFYLANGNGGTNALYTLDKTTGVLTLVGPTGIADAAGLAFKPVASSVPEPSSVPLLVSLSVTGACFVLRRRSKRNGAP